MILSCIPIYTGNVRGSYPYTSQLQALDSCDNRVNGHPLVPTHLQSIVTPINLHFWQQELQTHRDKEFTKLILKGLAGGFRIGFKPERLPHKLKPAKLNMLLALEHPKEVDDYIAKELSTSHLAVYENPLVQVQTSPLGVIPKKGKENRWRLIMDLSAPHGSSVNDGIDRDFCSFHYVSVDTAAARMHNLGRGALLAKMDIKQAYRHIPVAPEDRHLLGLSWKGETYIDQVLPFGLRLAPLIFSAVADALQWIMINRGVSWTIHYIDDFLTMGAPHSKECGSNMKIMEATCAAAGLPIEPAKSVGPVSCLTFLGIELDSVEGLLRLPKEKLQNIMQILQQWRGYKACKKRNLLSLIGVLSHAAKVVKPGRAFLRRLIDLSTSVEKLDHFIRLNVEARSNIEWWWQFISRWNGISAAPSLVHLPPDIQFTSDASGRGVVGRTGIHTGFS